MLLDVGTLAWLRVNKFLSHSAKGVEQSPGYIDIALGNFVHFAIEVRGIGGDEVDSIAGDG